MASYRKVLFVTLPLCVQDKSCWPYIDGWINNARISVLVTPAKPPNEFPYSRFTRWEKDPGFVKGLYTSITKSKANYAVALIKPFWLADLCASIAKAIKADEWVKVETLDDSLNIVPATTYFYEKSLRLKLLLDGLTLDSLFFRNFLQELSHHVEGGLGKCLNYLNLSTPLTGT